MEIARADARSLKLLELCAQVERDDQSSRALRVAGTTLLGITSEGIPLLLRLGSPDVPHVLIVGTTGSGKSQAARTLLASLIMYQPTRKIQLLLIDPKGTEFRAFQGLPHLVCPIVSGAAEARERLEWLVQEMERRQQAQVRRPRIVVLIDELADLLQQGGSGLEEL